MSAGAAAPHWSCREGQKRRSKERHRPHRVHHDADSMLQDMHGRQSASWAGLRRKLAPWSASWVECTQAHKHMYSGPGVRLPSVAAAAAAATGARPGGGRAARTRTCCAAMVRR
eukprot:scaffold2261_cov405-Prasinococcus_capsulatus_cf.AAC.23